MKLKQGKMKIKGFLLICVIFITHASFSQLKVDRFGRIGMGTLTPDSNYKCHISGNLLLSSWPSNPSYDLRLRVGSGWPGTEIGSSADMIAFWSTHVEYNKLYAERYYKMSDSSYKFNLAQISSPLDKILQLKPYAYDFKDNYISAEGDSLTRFSKQYGFISQQVEKTLPEIEITEDGKGGKLMDYDQIIPLLVAGMQEQQKQIRAMEVQMARLIAQTSQDTEDSKSNGIGSRVNNNESHETLCNLSGKILNSTKETNIPYYLSDNTSTAEIKIWDSVGNEIELIKLNPQPGNGSASVQSSRLKVNDKYTYALFSNGQMVDAKTLVFSEK